jgi:subtilisin family serine protease
MRHLITASLLLTLLIGGVGVSSAANPAAAAAIPLNQINQRQIIVQLKQPTARGASAVLTGKGVSLVRKIALSYRTYDLVQVPAGQDYNATLAALNSDPAVQLAYPNVLKHASEVVPNDPSFLNGAGSTTAGLQQPFVNSNQWALLQTRANLAWDTTTGTSDTVVAVLDTGAALSHEDLAGRLWTNPGEVANNSVDDDGNGFVDDLHGFDFETYSGGTGGDPDPSDASAESHGTATASIIAGEGNNSKGIMGVAGGTSSSTGARLMILRVGTAENIPLSAEIAALDYAHDMHARVISMSFGGVTGGQPEEDAVNNAWDGGSATGCLVIAAAGNGTAGNGTSIDLPAGFANCVCVGATTIFGTWPVTSSTPIVPETRADFSKQGPEMDIAAPGVNIIAAASGTSTYFNTPFMQFTGTSAATPVVAGLAALLFSAKPSLTPSGARDAIYSTAVDLGASGVDNEFGHGRIDMKAALDLVAPNIKAGDTNGDGVVDNNDIQPIIDHFGAHSGDGNYDARIDQNNDGVIDELDLFPVGRNFGK